MWVSGPEVARVCVDILLHSSAMLILVSWVSWVKFGPTNHETTGNDLRGFCHQMGS